MKSSSRRKKNEELSPTNVQVINSSTTDGIVPGPGPGLPSLIESREGISSKERVLSISESKKKNNKLPDSSVPVFESRSSFSETQEVIPSLSSVVDETEYIYLIREREFIRTNDNVYKVGRTKQQINNSIRRFDEYPKGSEPVFLIKVSSAIKAEADVLKMMKQQFKQRIDYGKEYFEGDVNSMIFSIIKKIENDPQEKANKKVIDELTKKVEELNQFKTRYENLKNGLNSMKNIVSDQFQNFMSMFVNLSEN
jgi:hypothetical protein